MKALLMAVVLSVVCATNTQAQALPVWTLEAAVGGGRHPERSGEIYYNSGSSIVIRYAASLSLPIQSRVSAFVYGEVSPDVYGDHIDICTIAPNGTCIQYFEDNDGTGLAVGLRIAIIPELSASLMLGRGHYNSDSRSFGGGQITLRGGSHLGLVLDARHMQWTHKGLAHWYTPVSIGLQLF